jgi:hypothetical protein
MSRIKLGFIPLWDAVHRSAGKPDHRARERWQFVLRGILRGRATTVMPVLPFSQPPFEQIKDILMGLDAGRHPLNFVKPLFAIRVRGREIKALLKRFHARPGPPQGRSRFALTDMKYCAMAHELVLSTGLKPWTAIKRVTSDGKFLAGRGTDRLSRLKRAALLYNQAFRGQETF